MVKWLPVIAAGLIFLSGCAPVVKENGKTMPRIDGEAKIEWNREKYPLAVEILNSHGEKERQVFYSPPKRVAAVWQNSIETLLALGVGDRIIAGMGVPDRKYIREEYQAGYEAIPYKSLENLDPETIMMMRPDFIAGWIPPLPTRFSAVRNFGMNAACIPIFPKTPIRQTGTAPLKMSMPIF